MTTAELGKTYYYAIRAVSLAGAGEWTQQFLDGGRGDARPPKRRTNQFLRRL